MINRIWKDEKSLTKLFLLISIFFLPFVISISHLTLFISLIIFIKARFNEKNLNQLLSSQLDYVVLLFFAASLLSLVNLTQPYANMGKAISSMLIMVEAMAYYFITKWAVEKEDIKAIIQILLVQGLILAVYGIFQYFIGGGEPRVSSFTKSPNTLPNYFIIIISLGLVMFFTNLNSKKKYLVAGSIILMLICLFLTFSRGGWLGLIISIILFTFLTNRKVFLYLLSAGLLSLPALIHAIGDRTHSDLERIRILQSGWNIFKDHSIIGIGIGQFKSISPAYKLWENDFIHTHVHNMIFQTFVETGLIGGLVFLLLLFSIFKLSKDFLKYSVDDKFYKMTFLACIAGLCGILGHGLVDDPFYDDGPQLLTWFMLGITAALAQKNMFNIRGIIDKQVEIEKKY